MISVEIMRRYKWKKGYIFNKGNENLFTITLSSLRPNIQE